MSTCDWPTSDQFLSCYARTQLPWNLRFLSTSFQLPKLCRCLYWDHALSLESESIMLSLWPTPMKQLTWLHLLPKIAYTFQPVVVFTTPSHRVLYRRVLLHDLYIINMGSWPLVWKSVNMRKEWALKMKSLGSATLPSRHEFCLLLSCISIRRLAGQFLRPRAVSHVYCTIAYATL